jgi:hypothetical protein
MHISSDTWGALKLLSPSNEGLENFNLISHHSFRSDQNSTEVYVFKDNLYKLRMQIVSTFSTSDVHSLDHHSRKLRQPIK